MVAIIYSLLTVIPTALLAYLTLQAFTIIKVAALVGVLAFHYTA